MKNAIKINIKDVMSEIESIKKEKEKCMFTKEIDDVIVTSRSGDVKLSFSEIADVINKHFDKNFTPNMVYKRYLTIIRKY